MTDPVVRTWMVRFRDGTIKTVEFTQADLDACGDDIRNVFDRVGVVLGLDWNVHAQYAVIDEMGWQDGLQPPTPETVDIPVELPLEVIARLALKAHEANLTLNDYIVQRVLLPAAQEAIAAGETGPA